MAPNFRYFKSPGETGGSTGNYGAAHGMTDLGAIFGTLNARGGDYDSQLANNAKNYATISAKYQLGEDQKDAWQTMLDAEENYFDMVSKGAKAKRSGEQKGQLFSTIGKVAGIGLGLALSDETTKHTIEEIEDATELLRNLRPVSFNYKEEFTHNPELRHYGFIAQEFQNVLPDATFYDSSLDKYCIDTKDLIAILVRANQELTARVTRLEAKNALAASVK